MSRHERCRNDLGNLILQSLKYALSMEEEARPGIYFLDVMTPFVAKLFPRDAAHLYVLCVVFIEVDSVGTPSVSCSAIQTALVFTRICASDTGSIGSR